MSAVLRRQRRNYRHRPLAWLEAADGLEGVLLEALELGAATVYLIDPERRLGTLGALRAWRGAGVPAGWLEGEHYLKAPNPVLRYKHLATGRELRVLRASSWFGEGHYGAGDAATAHHELGLLLRGMFDEGAVLETPASTGRYLLLRSIAHGREWPVLEAETQELVRATSGQARRHVIARAGGGELVEYDGRMMYGALVQELGAGEPERDHVGEYAGYRRGRYHVRAIVPADWSDACACGAPGHNGIGLLPFAEPDGSWSWPAEPRHAFTTWCDGAELRLALEHGWRCEVRERLLYPWPPYPALERASGQRERRGPLDAWGDRLVRAYLTRAATGDALVRAALRAVVLHTIGALHGRGHAITHTTSIDNAGEVPAEALEVERVGEELVWTVAEGAAWPEMSHPEWSSAVWARARAALLSRNGTGALHVPAEHVLGFDTDALYLAADPRWTDHGRAGELRVVRRWRDVAHPAGVADLWTLKREPVRVSS